MNLQQRGYFVILSQALLKTSNGIGYQIKPKDLFLKLVPDLCQKGIGITSNIGGEKSFIAYLWNKVDFISCMRTH